MIEAQYLSMIALGFGSFIFGMIPLKLSNTARKSHPFLLSLLLCLGGGVLLATSLVHMLAEVKEKLEKYAELYLCAGFFLLYTIDEITHFCLGDLVPDVEKIPEETTQSRSNSEEALIPKKTRPRANTTYGTISESQHDELLNRRQSYSGNTDNDHYQTSKIFRYKSEEIHPTNQFCCTKHKRESSWHRGAVNIISQKDDSSPSTSQDHQHHHDQDHQHHYLHHHHHEHHQQLQSQCHVDLGEPCVSNPAGIAGLLVALLIHSIIEGTSIGVQSSSSQILLVLGAVSCHKFVLAFCLGIELSSSGYQSFKFVAAITAFAIGSPIGIGIGMALTSQGGLLLLEGPLQAVAAGSLLYVAAFEVLPRERFKWQHDNEHKVAGLAQLLFVGIGFSCITLLTVFLVSDHGGETPNMNVTAT